MSQKDFFKQLKDEFPEHPYRDRYLEELQNHVEDMKEEKLKEGMWNKRMGEVKKIKENFIKIMNPFGALFFILEGILVGILLGFASMLFYVNLTLISNIQYLWQSIFLNLVIISIIWFIGHLIALKLFLRIKNLSGLREKTWIFLTNLPSLLLCFYITYPTLLIFRELNTYDIAPILWIFVNALILFLSYKIYKNPKIQPVKIKGSNPLFLLNGFLFTVLSFLDFKYFSTFIIIAILGLFLFINLALFFLNLKYKKKGRPFEINLSIIFWLAVISIFLRTLLTYTDMDFWANHSYLLLPLFPIFLLDIIFETTWFLNGYESLWQYIPFIILIYIIFQSIFILLKQRTLSYVHFFLLIYCLSFFFINKMAFILDPHFKKDSVLVSQMIEQDQFSIFYPYLKYFNVDKSSFFKGNLDFDGFKSNLFDYEISLYSPKTGENYFVLKNLNIKDTYFIDINKLNEIDFRYPKDLLQKNLFDIDISSYPYNVQDVIPPHPNCIPETCTAGFSLHPNIINQYSGVNIIDVEEDKLPFTVNGLKISPDKKWLLAVFQLNSESSGQEVYLVKLKD